MAKKKQKRIEQYKVFNRQIILFAASFLILLTISFGLLATHDTDIALFLLVIALFVCSGIFLTPLYFVFSSKSLTAVWLLPFKKTIYWTSISNIIEYKLFSAVDNLAKYEIMYRFNHKGCQIIKQFDLPRNKKTKKLIEKYAKYKIV